MKYFYTIYLFLILAEVCGQQRNYASESYHRYLNTVLKPNPDFISYNQDSKESITLKLRFVNLTTEVKKEQLSNQVLRLNQDFSNFTFEKSNKPSAQYQQLAVDTQIRFSEKFEINDYEIPKILDFALSLELAEKHKSIYPDEVLIFIYENNSLAGYAQTPEFPKETEAIFINKNYLIGSTENKYDLGKTLTHLMGSFFGLGELWDCKDDGVADTPKMTVQHQTNDESWSACYNYVVPTMYQNFMYNAPDEHLNMFTVGQKNKMLSVIASQKTHLIQNHN
jgi:hypothetical protein